MKTVRSACRFSMLGGGSDKKEFFETYADCQIISMALDYFNYIAYSTSVPYAKDKTRYDITTPTARQQVEKAEDIANDLIRVAFTCSEHDKTLKHTLISWSDISTCGSGLGGSSSFAVGLATIMGSINPLFTAIDWEINKLKSPIGYQDHIIASLGGFRYFTINNVGKISSQSLPNGDFIAEHLMMFDLGKHRTESGDAVTNHDTLVDMNLNMEERAKIIKESLELTLYMLSAIKDKDIKGIGEILDVAWNLKKLSHGSFGIADDLYKLGLKMGAYGGKVGGSLSKGGGHLFLISELDKRDSIIEALSPYVNYRPVKIAHHGVTMQYL